MCLVVSGFLAALFALLLVVSLSAPDPFRNDARPLLYAFGLVMAAGAFYEAIKGAIANAKRRRWEKSPEGTAHAEKCRRGA